MVCEDRADQGRDKQGEEPADGGNDEEDVASDMRGEADSENCRPLFAVRDGGHTGSCGETAGHTTCLLKYDGGVARLEFESCAGEGFAYCEGGDGDDAEVLVAGACDVADAAGGGRSDEMPVEQVA